MGFLKELERITMEQDREDEIYEREMARLEREDARDLKELEKLEAEEDARDEVEEYEELITRLLAPHRAPLEIWPWEPFIEGGPPPPPVPLQPSSTVATASPATMRAEREVADYRPGFFTKAFGNPQKKLQKLQKALEDSRREDHQRTAAADAKRNEGAFQRHKAMVSLHRLMLRATPNARTVT